MSLNRKQNPEFKNIENINIPVPKKMLLENGIETYVINAGTQEIIKIDLIFNAGSLHQSKPIIATVVNEMLIEGTTNYSSQQIAEKLDFFGAFIHSSPTKDFGNITLYTLKKYLPDTIQILEEIVKHPSFPENEIQTFLNKRKQTFEIEMEKVSAIARREFNEQLFGKNHPYGLKTVMADYNNINQDDLIQFHKNNYYSGNCKIIVSGKVDDSVIEVLKEHFGKTDWNNQSGNQAVNFPLIGEPVMESFVKKENVTQSAIRLGKLVVNKDHSDYHKLNIVNTILGGYFGSRLMKSIREDKGYTYGINSILVSLKHAAYIVILSEVGADVSRNAIDDILIEIKKLRTEKVGTEELALVKNYMAGDLLRSFDGPFEISSSFSSIIESELNTNFYHKALEAIQTITPDEVLEIANKYLQEDTLIKTVAGKYN